jgi:DNA-binding NtrC family response regulator
MRILEEETIHVVMTDQRMPQMTGVEVLRRAKTEHPQATRLIFTGYADINAVIAAINQGHVFRFVAKPWEPDELVAVLREAGEQYDKIVERRQLLVDLKHQEQKCITFAEDLRATPGEVLAAERAAQLEALVRSSQALLARLTSILESTEAVAIS